MKMSAILHVNEISSLFNERTGAKNRFEKKARGRGNSLFKGETEYPYKILVQFPVEGAQVSAVAQRS